MNGCGLAKDHKQGHSPGGTEWQHGQAGGFRVKAGKGQNQEDKQKR